MGHIQFLNCLPLYWGLIRSGALLDVELTKAGRRLRQGLAASREAFRAGMDDGEVDRLILLE